jgi:DNA-binding response OmpR family regulator
MSKLGKVLIIDDEMSLRLTLTRILQKAGCEIVTAADGFQAMRMFGEDPFDLVYLDIHLPEMNGLQILKEIRQRFPKLPVILLTGHGSLQSAMQAIHLGATDYLLKPIDPEVLVARTRVVLQEQAEERRKREIREQISALQAELRALEQDSQAQLAGLSLLPEPQDRFLKRGRLILDLQAQRAILGESVLSLPPASFAYLVVLARYSPDVVDYRMLVTEAQNYQVDIGEARELAKWHIHIIRQAIEPDPQDPHYILNVRGIGYRLLAD